MDRINESIATVIVQVLTGSIA